jgi:hypothetical protein
MDPEDKLGMEQIMDEENHVLQQAEMQETDKQQ